MDFVAIVLKDLSNRVVSVDQVAAESNVVVQLRLWQALGIEKVARGRREVVVGEREAEHLEYLQLSTQ